MHSSVTFLPERIELTNLRQRNAVKIIKVTHPFKNQKRTKAKLACELFLQQQPYLSYWARS